MNDRHIEANSEVNVDNWRRFVTNHHKGSIFQSKEIFDLYDSTPENKPMVIALSENKEIIGLIVSNTIISGRFCKYITARSIIIGGPLAKDDDPIIIEQLLSEYLKRAPRYVIYSEIRPLFDQQSISQTFLNMGFSRIGHYNLWIDISVDETDLWNQLHKERRRNIKKAQNAGLVYKEVRDKSSIQQVINLIKRTYKRKRVPLTSDNLFNNSQQYLNDHIRFFAALYEGRIIAGQIRLLFKDLAYAWYAGSDETYFKLYPNDFLMWNVILWSHNNGYKVFDLGGGGEPGKEYGVRDYKLKYGCKMEDYGRFIYYHKPLIYKTAKLAMNLLGMKKG